MYGPVRGEFPIVSNKDARTNGMKSHYGFRAGSLTNEDTTGFNSSTVPTVRCENSAQDGSPNRRVDAFEQACASGTSTRQTITGGWMGVSG